MPTRSTQPSKGACLSDNASGWPVVRVLSPLAPPAFEVCAASPTDVRASKLSKSSRASDWVAEITNVWSRAGAHTMELARVVSAIRGRLRHGEWSQLWKTGRMPFAKRKGVMLVAIGERMGWVDAQIFARLPAGRSVLYQLAWVPREDFGKLLEQGAIHPKLMLREAKELVAKINGRPKKNASRTNTVQRRLNLFSEYVERTLSQWKPEERELARSALGCLLEQLDTRVGNHVGRELVDGRASRPLGRRIFPEAPRVATSLTP